MNRIKSWLLYKILREIKNSSLQLIKIIVKRIRYTIGNIITIIKDHYYDKGLGITTAEHYYFKDDLSLYKDGIRYVPTPYQSLKEIVDYLKLKPDDVFVDFGCGKGRVISFMAVQRMKKVIGIEIHKELADIAKTNLNNLKSKNTSVEIFNMDAAIFDAKEGTIFFMFHPFGEKTAAKVIENIRSTVATSPKKIRILYYGPAFDKLLNSQDWLMPEGEIGSTEILAWHNRYQKNKNDG
jgi:SAM-dependent methyltransferase